MKLDATPEAAQARALYQAQTRHNKRALQAEARRRVRRTIRASARERSLERSQEYLEASAAVAEAMETMGAAAVPIEMDLRLKDAISASYQHPVAQTAGPAPRKRSLRGKF